MGLCGSIKIEPVAIKTPGARWRFFKSSGVGNITELDVFALQAGISPPKAGIAPEIGQAGIHPHACACRYEEAIRLFDIGDRLLELCISQLHFNFHLDIPAGLRARPVNVIETAVDSVRVKIISRRIQYHWLFSLTHK